ncbi:MAG: sulfatase-like hydrolase/transferase [Phycisphaerales bacterium]|nr:MAG: sulfatase-like hydrolase/transferase [Phycisphaerales bacterium]
MTSEMSRRDLVKAAGLTAASLAVSSCDSATAADKGSSDKPNIVLIMADDLGYECLGCYGSTSYKTPVLDELADGGMRFEHCYSQPLCTPSRVQIMTGKYNSRNYTVFGSLDPKETTFGHVMRKSGYATCVAGKWQLYGGGSGTSPEKAGFDEYCLWQVKDRGSRYSDPTVLENGRLRGDIEGGYGPDIFCDFINGFIERHKDRPFFVYYPMALTHGPFEPTPDSRGWREGKHKADKKFFADMVAYMDKNVGRISRKLGRLGLRENTLILFTSDNGTPRGVTSRLGLVEIKGGKGLTTDAGTHAPLIANWKGTIPAGRICGDLVDFSDMLPTLAEAAGAKMPPNLKIDGRSFLPQLRGEKGRPRDWIFCYYRPNMKKNKWGLKIFARDKKYKLYDTGELFDVEADPLERSPVVRLDDGGQAATARKRLQTVLDSML